MRFPLAIAVLAAVLSAHAVAHASSAASERAPSPPVAWRCVEQPMSLAIAIAEYNASHGRSPRSLMSVAGRPVTAALLAPPVREAHPVPQPFTPLPRACTSPGEPGCEASTPLPAPARVYLEQVDHGVFLAPGAIRLPSAVAIPLRFDRPAAVDGARDAHGAAPWRPPAA